MDAAEWMSSRSRPWQRAALIFASTLWFLGVMLVLGLTIPMSNGSVRPIGRSMDGGGYGWSVMSAVFILIGTGSAWRYLTLTNLPPPAVAAPMPPSN